jgi:site-specific recombinase XerD
LTVEEVTRLIDAARTLTDRTMLMVLYSTGMRNAEMRSLQVKNIDSRSMLIHIEREKGGRDRYVPLSATSVPGRNRGLARRQTNHAEGGVGCLSIGGDARPD